MESVVVKAQSHSWTTTGWHGTVSKTHYRIQWHRPREFTLNLVVLGRNQDAPQSSLSHRGTPWAS